MALGLVLAEGCSPAPVARSTKTGGAPPPSETKPAGPVEYEAKWRGLSNAAYLAPKAGAFAEDGAFDAIYFFHAGQAVEKELREVGLNAVIVAATLGLGSVHYSEAFQEPERFGRMVAELERSLAQGAGRKVRARRVALVAWSAGFGAPQKILAQPYDDLVDTVFLLDGLHAGYMDPPSAKRVDTRFIGPFAKFARAAIEGRKLMVITHSSVPTIDYATSKETTAALLEVVGTRSERYEGRPWSGMRMILEAHAGSLHVRGFAGGEKKDHVDHAHLVGILMTEYLAPRWAPTDVDHRAHADRR
jgi:hypothetical protein